MKTYAIDVDHEACWGCMACEVACKQENGAAEGIKLISVREDGPGMKDGEPYFVFRVKMCVHCDDPPCVDVCPEEAISKREDGVVVLDSGSCSGCEACVDACPYEAVVFDADKEIAQKCNLCHHRVDQGLIPACADNICLAHCIQFKTMGE
ncbi:MAG: 4Fe-4S ferredoxin [Desulfobacterales bacterium]|nr:4Fe-4S ferredoxin [Desulfobacterales bacterium]